MNRSRDRRASRVSRMPAVVSRLVATAATLLVLSGALAPAMDPAHAQVTRQTPGPCALVRGRNEGVRPYMKRLIRCAAKKWQVQGGAEKAICIARRESGLNPKALSPTGLYRGLFQHHKAYWPERYDDYTRRAWQLSRKALNGRSAVIVSIRMAHFGSWAAWKGEGC